MGGMGGASGASGMGAMGGAGGAGGSAGGDSPCFMVCDAQNAAEVAGDCVALSLAECRALCGTGGSCAAQFEAMHVCWLAGEFMCGFFSAESNADCQAEEDAYFACIQ
jgi:hypothetical protein